MNDVFIIDYEVFDVDNISIKKGQIKVKNKPSEFVAKCSLEDYLKKKYHLFHRLVIHKCTKDYVGIFNNMFGGFPFS